MRNPSHPGLIIRDDVLPELQLSVNEAAEQLGVSRVTLSRVINGRSAISGLERFLCIAKRKVVLGHRRAKEGKGLPRPKRATTRDICGKRHQSAAIERSNFS